MMILCLRHGCPARELQQYYYTDVFKHYTNINLILVSYSGTKLPFWFSFNSFEITLTKLEQGSFTKEQNCQHREFY